MSQNRSSSKLTPKPQSRPRQKSLSSNNSSKSFSKPASHPKHQRPKSVNQSYDFLLNSSKMFSQPNLKQSKFCPSAVPSPSFDVNICKEEISRIEAHLHRSQLLEKKMLRNDWRAAQRSMDLEQLIDEKRHFEFNLKQEKDFRSMRESTKKQERKREREWKEEQFQAFKAEKLKKEREEKKRNYDDLLREKTKYLHSQEGKENLKDLVKSERSEIRNSQKAYIRAVKDRNFDEKIRLRKEMEFEYAQEIGAKWLKLKTKDDEVNENIEILNKLMC